MLVHKMLQSAGGTPSDPNFENVTLLLHGDGTNGGQNNTFVDGSTNNFTITRNGNTTQGSFSPYGDLWSNYFDGTGDYLNAGSSISLSGDFTVEGWFYPTTASGNGYYLFGLGNDYFSSGATFFINTSGYLRIYTGNAHILSGTSGVAQLNTWNHVAFVRSSTTLKAYLNGVQVDTATWSSAISGTAYIGAELNGNPTAILYVGSAAYYSNVRIGTTAVYTTAFTPSTTPLTAITGTQLLTCQSNRFRDNSSNNFTITRNGDVSVQRFSPFSPSAAYSTATIGGSGYFDGTGDYLSAPSSSALEPGSGDFTIEAWIYPLSYPASGVGAAIADRSNTSGYANFTVNLRSNGAIEAYFSLSNTSSIPNVITAGNCPIGAWTHVAFVKSGLTRTLYINGVQVGTVTSASNPPTGLSTITKIGQADGTLNGYLSNVRIAKSAVYTTTFTPPTAPLTAITNTSLLLNFTNASIFDNAMMADLETVGNAQISTSVKKYGTGSLAFDGNGDYLFVPANPSTSLGSGDFTVEFWLYSGASGGIVLVDWLTGGVANPQLYTNGANLIWYAAVADRITGTSVLASSTWQHIAVVRSSGSTKMYVSGTQVGSTYTDTNNYTNTLSSIGGRAAGNSLNGYIDDLRITKGVARYTGNFTPPAAPFPNK